MDARVLFRGDECDGGIKLTTHLRLVPRLRMTGTTPLFPTHAFMAWTGKPVPLPLFSKQKPQKVAILMTISLKGFDAEISHPELLGCWICLSCSILNADNVHDTGHAHCIFWLPL